MYYHPFLYSIRMQGFQTKCQDMVKNIVYIPQPYYTLFYDISVSQFFLRAHDHTTARPGKTDTTYILHTNIKNLAWYSLYSNTNIKNLAWYSLNSDTNIMNLAWYSLNFDTNIMNLARYNLFSTYKHKEPSLKQLIFW